MAALASAHALLFTTITDAGLHRLAMGSCGWGVLYGTFTMNPFAELEVRP